MKHVSKELNMQLMAIIVTVIIIIMINDNNNICKCLEVRKHKISWKMDMVELSWNIIVYVCVSIWGIMWVEV